jgi:hypothetical protein
MPEQVSHSGACEEPTSVGFFALVRGAGAPAPDSAPAQDRRIYGQVLNAGPHIE